jgi:hypothetical protein
MPNLRRNRTGRRGRRRRLTAPESDLEIAVRLETDIAPGADAAECAPR